jgi:two-component system, OmpR family, response regulator
MPTLLVVDDDAHIRDVVQYALEREGFAVRTAADGAKGLAALAEGGVDLVVLDILMPELDGFEFCRRARAAGDVAIIFLSSKGDEVDRIVGLELGGDDYLPKPFSPRELVARVRAVLRRRAARAEAAPGPAPTARLAVGPVVLDDERHEVTCSGRAVELTVTEFTLLRTLLERPGRVLTRQGLVEVIYRFDYHITERTIDTHVRRIRAKFRPSGHDPIETVHGLGYKARVP